MIEEGRVTKEELEKEGYIELRQLPAGEWIGVFSFLYTFGLVVGVDDSGYRKRFCYEHWRDAVVAARTWDGTGDPPGPWIKQKGAEGERLGPGAKG